MEGCKPIIGIVGGIGAGKTTVASEFCRLGCGVISADGLNHEILEREEIIEHIKEIWGLGVLKVNGSVDRRALGEIVFGDAEEMGKLTDLVHPFIAKRQAELVSQYQEDTGVRAIVLDVPLLFEVGHDRLCDVVVFVESDWDIRSKRTAERLGWEKKQQKKAENLQLALDKKAKMSDYTICNNSGLSELAFQVDRLLSTILGANR